MRHSPGSAGPGKMRFLWRFRIGNVRRMRRTLAILLVVAAFPAFRGLAAEKVLDFGEVPEGQCPTNFRSTVTGKGKPGEWKIVLDEERPLLAPLTPQARSVSVTKKAVLAQVSKDPTDNHYPLLIYEGESFSDFKLSTRFKIVAGGAEQMAGVAFRIQDENNYYYVRASALGNTFYFFKFVKGELIGPIGSKVEITRNTWHEMEVDCQGSQITCSLDGKALIPQMQQDTFSRGKIGFWTKSDSVSYFSDTKISYKPLELPAQVIVREVLKKYPRLLALKLYVPGKESSPPALIATGAPVPAGETGGKTEMAVLTTAETWFGKENDSVSVIMPIRDRNGDVIAAARVVMKSFRGQTEQNAIIRAAPIVREIQARVRGLDDLMF
jgi:hypothetical protein